MKLCKICGYKNEDSQEQCARCRSALGAAQAEAPQRKKDFALAEAANLQEGGEVVGENGVYRIVGHIADGGFGSVYQVKKDGQCYAMKIIQLRKILPDDREMITRRFHREYEAGQVDSPYIVRSVDKGEVKGNPFIIMDFCPNGTLRHRMETKLSAAEACTYAGQILKGLATMHKHGIIHKDLKPENVLFDPDDLLRLTDFGIAGFLNNRETRRNIWGAAKSVFGTALYAPPEQLKPNVAFKSMGPTNDIYAFGVMFYEMMTGGELPFGKAEELDKDVVGYYKRMEQGEMINPRSFNPLMPANYCRIIEGCLKPNPAERFQQADEVLALLEGSGSHDATREAGGSRKNWLLRVVDGDEPGRVYNLNEMLQAKMKLGARQLLTLGYLNPKLPAMNDIGIAELHTNYISTRHATLEPATDAKGLFWYVRDGQYYTREGAQGWWASTNGVLVNSAQADVNGSPLMANDILTIGDTTLRVELEE